jgi:hypothetical protein
MLVLDTNHFSEFLRESPAGHRLRERIAICDEPAVLSVVSAFAETSFLFAFYFPRTVSEQAVAKMQSLSAAPLISTLVHYEFHQAVWFDVWRRANGNPQGLSQEHAQVGSCSVRPRS